MTRRVRDRDGTFRTAQVAKILGISPRTLYRMLADGRVTEPMRNPENRYRMWTNVDLQGIREALQNQ
jgi:DNA-binding transcriptional MerR regulator